LYLRGRRIRREGSVNREARVSSEIYLERYNGGIVLRYYN